MKNRIVALMLVVITVCMCCGFTSSSEQHIEYVDRMVEVERVVEVDRCFKVDKEAEFTDANIDTYTMEQLKGLIQIELDKQKTAQELATSARALGWPEDSPAIQSAQAEWWNAQQAIDVYDAKYQELYVEYDMAKWDEKMAQYPAATEVWLYMKDLGWNDYVCAGIMGNLMAEVGGQTLNLQYWLKGNGYYGMCQWNKAYQDGVWGADLKGQCDFLRDTIKYEIDTFGYAYKKGFKFDSFLALTNEKDAALAFAKAYERCGSGSYSVRQKNATNAYNYFVNN